MIARYTLNVYDEDFEIVKTLEAPGLRWGKLIEIIEKASEGSEEIAVIEDIMLMIFPTATKDDLKNCMIEDMVAVFGQIMRLAQAGGLTGPASKGKQKPKNQ